MDNSSSNLWGGRFTSPSDPALVAISKSVHFDWRLARYDLLQTLAHAQVLLDASVLTASEFDSLKVVLKQMSKEINSKELNYEDHDEDVHSAIERIITNRLPEIGPKLRTGRSRNDQVATDLRLYLRDMNQEVIKQVAILGNAISDLALSKYDLPAAGYTHLQHAQVVTLGHELNKHSVALLRDCQRAIELDKRIAVSPLGSGALAGSSFNLDVSKSAKFLNFEVSAVNSIDAVSDRDFVVEFLFNISMIGLHLAKLAEEIILYTSIEFGFAKLHDSWSTGSSLMPQKKNPDIAELTRGKSGRFIGNLTSLLVTLKALPFAYNRDLQEDKEPVFDSIDQILLVLPAMTGLVSTLEFDDQRIRTTAKIGHTAATDVADYLVKNGVPFSKSHEITGQLVMKAEELGTELADLPLVEFQKISSVIQQDLPDLLVVSNLVNQKTSKLGTAPISVKHQIEDTRSNFKPVMTWAADKLVHLL
jgi:argininosuccinate lyase